MIPGGWVPKSQCGPSSQPLSKETGDTPAGATGPQNITKEIFNLQPRQIWNLDHIFCISHHCPGTIGRGHCPTHTGLQCKPKVHGTAHLSCELASQRPFGRGEGRSLLISPQITTWQSDLFIASLLPSLSDCKETR